MSDQKGSPYTVSLTLEPDLPRFCFFFSSSSTAGGASPVLVSRLGAFSAGPVYLQIKQEEIKPNSATVLKTISIINRFSVSWLKGPTFYKFQSNYTAIVIKLLKPE